jgi:hypothetical protein
MTTNRTTDKYTNFRILVRGRVMKGVMNLNKEQMQILKLIDFSGLLKSRGMQERRPIPV